MIKIICNKIDIKFLSCEIVSVAQQKMDICPFNYLIIVIEAGAKSNKTF